MDEELILPGEPQPQEPPSSEEFGLAVIKAAFEQWINPELQRRKDAGLLPEKFALVSAQRLQRPDGSVEIRINQEVRGVARVPERDMQPGDLVRLDEVEGLEEFDLHEEELDCGHMTLLHVGGSWFCSFNFQSNRGKCAIPLDKASQFLGSSRAAFEAGHAAVVVDNLFSACELIAKAELVASHVIGIDSRTHGSVARQLNLWRKAGNIQPAFVDLFNKMFDLRGPYRYDAGFSERMPVSLDDFELVAEMIALGLYRVRRKVE